MNPKGTERMRIEELVDVLAQPLGDPEPIVEVLVAAMARGQSNQEMWDALHQAAARDGRLVELATAYQKAVVDKRVKLLPPEQWVELHLGAARVIGTLVGETEIAVDVLGRCLAANPGHEPTLALMQELLAEAGQPARFARVLLDTARNVVDRDRQLGLLEQVAWIAQTEPDAEALGVEAYERILRLDPGHRGARDVIEARMMAAGHYRDAAQLLERSMARIEDVEEANAVRHRLATLYISELGEPQKAIPHVETLLASNPSDQRATQIAEALLQMKPVAGRAAAALADAHEKLGNLPAAAAMLDFELEFARGARRTEVQRRLAVLRQDVLGDPAGALELLGPVVAGDPGNDEVRARFLALSEECARVSEASRLLGRALQACKDPVARARIGVDLGTLFYKSGETARAQAAWQHVIEAGLDDTAMLRSAQGLLAVAPESAAPVTLVPALEIVARLDVNPEPRHRAARQLVELFEGELNDPARALPAWHALMDSAWSAEAIAKLEAAYRESHDDLGLADVMDRKAELTNDPGEAGTLSFQAAELRAASFGDRAAVIDVWRSYVERHGPSEEAYARLLGLLEQEKRWEEYCAVLERQVELLPEDRRAPSLGQLGEVRLTQLGDMVGALEAFRLALAVDPADKVGRQAVEGLLGSEVAGAAAAIILEPIYRAEGAHSGLVKVLETRAMATEDPGDRMVLLAEAVQIADAELKNPARALPLAGWGLREAVDYQPESVGPWLAHLRHLTEAAGDPTILAQLLTEVLGDREVDSAPLLELAIATGDALMACGEWDAAGAVFRRGLLHDPSSPELLRRMDELLAQQASPEERFDLYRSALEQGPEPARRRELLHALALLQRRDLGDPAGAMETWKQAILEEPSDWVAHQALIGMFTQQQNWPAVYAQLEQALAHLEGQRRTQALLQMVDAAVATGEIDRAVQHCRELLADHELDDTALANMEHVVRQNGDNELVRELLLRRVDRATNVVEKAQLLHRLGEVQSGDLKDPKAAAAAWSEAARLLESSGGDEAAACRLYERVLEVSPDDRNAADRLLELRARRGEFDQLARPFSVVLRLAPDGRDAIAWLTGIETHAVASGALDAYLGLVEAALQADPNDKVAAQLLSVKARVLGTDPGRSAAAMKVHQQLLRMLPGDPSVADSYEQFLTGREQTPETIKGRRWLFRWRVEHSPDPTDALMAWAQAEANAFGDAEAATHLYEQVLKKDPDRIEALTELARLRSVGGDPEGALSAIRALRERLEGDQRRAADLTMARLLMEGVGRPDEAMDLVEPLVEQNPGDADLLTIVQQGLAHPATQQRSVALIERIAENSEDVEAQATMFETLLGISAGQAGFSGARGRWYRRLVAYRSDTPEVALEMALRGAEELAEDYELWTEAEQLARQVGTPQPVVDAYSRTLGGVKSPESAEALGKRLVEFYEEWFEEPQRVLDLLETVRQASPGVGWAFHRLKLAFNASGRWEDLFRLYDGALEQSTDPAQQIELLREVSMAAKDFAGDVDRAIGYLVRLHELQPRDTRVEASLERLYERHGHSRPLIDLLNRRVASSEGEQRLQLLARVAGLWLDLNDPLAAFELVERLIEESGDPSRSIELLERLLMLPAARESQVPPGPQDTKGGKRKRRRPPTRSVTVRERSAEYLLKYYESVGRVADVVRMLEVEVEVAPSDEERARRLRRVVDVRLSQLDDQAGALENLMTLVELQPQDVECRAQLDELAERTGARQRQAQLLVALGEAAETTSLRVSLWSEAAGIYQRALGRPDTAIELLQHVLRAADEDRQAALLATRELDHLLEEAKLPAERCTVLERRAALETDADARSAALGQVGQVAMTVLGDPHRAVRAWQQRLADDPNDSEALDGLVDALAMAQEWEALIQALEQRADRTSDPDRAKADRVHVAHVYTERLNEPERAIGAWRTARRLHGNDRTSFEALRSLLYATERYSDLARLLDSEVAEEADRHRQSEIYRELGDLHRSRTGQMLAALGAFVNAGDWDRAIEVATAVHDDPKQGRKVCETLLDLAVRAWEAEPGDANGPARAADWAIEELGRRLTAGGDFAAVVELLLKGSELGFNAVRRRTLRRDAAFLCADELGDAPRAIEIFRDLFAADPSDDVARESVDRLAALLEAQGATSEVAELWEEQARSRFAHGDRQAATLLWARAGEIWERRLGDVARAVEDYRQGAALGGEPSLEALARIYRDRGELLASAEVLEWLVAQSTPRRLAARALSLAEAYVAAGRSDRARARLEQVVPQLPEAGAVRQRLAELYRNAKEWGKLAALLADEAARATHPEERLSLLNEAARVHLEQRDDPAAAVPLLIQAVELRRDDYQLRLSLADALRQAERFADAANVLMQQIENYGARRPKERAVVHHALADALLCLGRREEAVAELQRATSIDPAHPGILRQLARLAFEGGEFDRAEQTYRALLLVLGTTTEPAGASRAEALLDMSEISLRRGNTVRAEEFIESAFESAASSEAEAAALEQILRARGQHALLGRSVQARLDAARSPVTAVRALADLAAYHLETAGSVAAIEQQLRSRAKSIYRELQAAAITDGDAWGSLGQVFKVLGDPDAEAKVLTQQVEALLRRGVSDPADADPMYRLAEVLLTQQPPRARGLELIERALEIHPDPERAVRVLRSALDLGVEEERAARLLERVARQLGDARVLAEALIRVLRLPVDPGRAAQEAVQLARQVGDTDLVEPLLWSVLGNERVLLEDTDAAWARLELARLTAGAGDVESALQLREDAAQFLAPAEQRAVLLDVAQAFAEQCQDLGRSARLYERLLQADPGDRAAWEPLLDTYRRIGDTGALIRLIENTAPLLAAPQDRARMRLEQAKLMLDRGEREEALEVLQQVVLEDPGQVQAASVLSELLEKTGRRDDLIALLIGQLDAAKDRQDVAAVTALSLRLGDLLEQQDRVMEALDTYQGVLDWNRRDREALSAVLRLSEQQQDFWRAADSLEGLLELESGEGAFRLTERLTALREQQNDPEGVERALRLGFERAPTQTVLRDRLLERYRQRGDWDSVSAVLSRALEAAPEDPQLLRSVVDARTASGQLRDALEAMNKLLSVSLADADLFRQRANLLAALGREAEAVADLEQAAELEPGHMADLVAALERLVRASSEPAPELITKLALLLEKNGDLTAARERLADLVEQQPQDRQALRHLARLCEAERDFAAAALAYTRLIQVEQGEDLVGVAVRLADISEQAEAFEAARWGLERALGEVPGHPEIIKRLRKVYRGAGAQRELSGLILNDAEAEQDPQRRLQLLLEAADLLLGPDGSVQEAWAVLEQARALAPDSPEVAILLARAYDQGGQSDDAMTILGDLIAVHRGRRLKTLAPAFQEMSRILLREGRLTEALESLTRAFDMDLRNGQLATELGQLALELDDLDVATRAFRAVTMMRNSEGDPSEGSTADAKADAQYYLAAIARQQGDQRKARILVAKALSANPDHERAKKLADELDAAGV